MPFTFYLFTKNKKIVDILFNFSQVVLVII